VHRAFERFLHSTVCVTLFRRTNVLRSLRAYRLLQDVSSVVGVAHETIDECVNFGLFAGHGMFLRRLILDLVLARRCILCCSGLVALIDEAGVAGAVAHDGGRWVDNLGGHASHVTSARVRLESSRPAMLSGWFPLTIPLRAGSFSLLQAITLLLELVVALVAARDHTFRRVLIHRAVMDWLEKVLMLG